MSEIRENPRNMPKTRREFSEAAAEYGN